MIKSYYYAGSFTLIFLLLLFWSLFLYIPVGWLILLLFVFSSPSVYVYYIPDDDYKELNERRVVRADL